MTQNNLITIVTMWNKVNELSRENLSQQQIAIKLEIHRDTVRRYQMMSESEFDKHLRRKTRQIPPLHLVNANATVPTNLSMPNHPPDCPPQPHYHTTLNP